METDLQLLIDEGRELPTLLRRVKARPVEETSDISTKVVNIVTNVLNCIQKASSNSGLTIESTKKLLDRIKSTLDDFVKHDSENKSKYEGLIMQVCNFQLRKEVASFASVTHSRNQGSSFDVSDDVEFESAYAELSVDDQKRLRCFLLFPAEAEIKKREIIHCWVGMGLIDSTGGESLLTKLVAIGLIQRVLVNKKLMNRYLMPKTIRSCLSDGGRSTAPQIKSDGPWSILFHQKDGNQDGTMKNLLGRLSSLATDQSSVPEEKVNHPEALLNVNHKTLDAALIKTISGMDNLKVLHLGRWQSDLNEYIMVDDPEAFKYLKSLSKVTFLSLEGVSGLKKLPESVYNFSLLKVLDLRGCNNLETLSSKIILLPNLTILDLSGCYLLDHVPLEITYLVNLEVLKGFVVTTDQQTQPKGQVKKSRVGSASSHCPFHKLSNLKRLRKLTILTRRAEFPTGKDFRTLVNMEHLSCLRITWVRNLTPVIPTGDQSDHVSGIIFPRSLSKLVLQAATEHTVKRLFNIISNNPHYYGFDKLYIRGGGLRDLNCFFPQLTILRLRYLPHLQIDWNDLFKSFPKLESLETFGCSNLVTDTVHGNSAALWCVTTTDIGESMTTTEIEENFMTDSAPRTTTKSENRTNDGNNHPCASIVIRNYI